MGNNSNAEFRNCPKIFNKESKLLEITICNTLMEGSFWEKTDKYLHHVAYFWPAELFLLSVFIKNYFLACLKKFICKRLENVY